MLLELRLEVHHLARLLARHGARGLCLQHLELSLILGREGLAARRRHLLLELRELGRLLSRQDGRGVHLQGLELLRLRGAQRRAARRHGRRRPPRQALRRRGRDRRRAGAHSSFDIQRACSMHQQYRILYSFNLNDNISMDRIQKIWLIFNLNINYIIILMPNFEEIKELLARWERHKNFLKIIKDSNISHVHPYDRRGQMCR